MENIRLEITIRKQTPKPLPFDYQYGLASMLLAKLRDVDTELVWPSEAGPVHMRAKRAQIAGALHDARGYKHYCLSNLRLLDGKARPPEGLHFHRATLLLGSPDPAFLQPFAEGLLLIPEFQLHRLPFIVEQIEVLPPVSDETLATALNSGLWLRTLSPIHLKTMLNRQPAVPLSEAKQPLPASQTKATDESDPKTIGKSKGKGKAREWDLLPGPQPNKGDKYEPHLSHPDSRKWVANLRANLLRRYTDYHGHPPEPGHDAFIVEALAPPDPGGHSRPKPKRVRIAGHYRRCLLATLKVRAAPGLVRFALDAGLGEKQGMGFGCVEVVEGNPCIKEFHNR